ncbi:MAG TPA: hypothetical protein ENJ50_02225 [Planctomycetaceae bacterium]|nr:hypothetical protein [Planctomycetaceae bacterium]
MANDVAVVPNVLKVDGHSVLYVDDDGRRFRLPIGNAAYLTRPELMDLQRASREVVTERDLFQCAGTFYELPARNAGGFRKIRPVATHPYSIQDYCSWRGLLVLTGMAVGAPAENEHVVRSSDGKCAVWLGAVDDLWEMGKPIGRGGPWTDALVKAGVPSDPYLMAGFDRKRVTIWHNASCPVRFRLEVDISGTGNWYGFKTVEVPDATRYEYRFPDEFAAYWVRMVADTNCRATVEFAYD